MACKDCKNCEKKGLLIYPLRYSAVSAGLRVDVAATQQAIRANPLAAPVMKPAGDIADLPHLNAKLGAGVSDLKLTTYSKYAARVVRKGFIYVLIERQGIKSWQAYAVLQNTQLYLFDADQPPTILPDDMCNRDGALVHSHMISIEDPEDVSNAWLLFSPVALTRRMLASYKTDPAALVAAGKLQHFSPANWVNGGVSQKHTLQAAELQKNVLEHILYCQYAAAAKTPLGQAASAQLFAPPPSAFAGVPPNALGEYGGTLGRVYTTLRANEGAAFVLYDHIGVTQELNDFRNSALAWMDIFLGGETNGVSNRSRLTVLQHLDEVKAGVTEGLLKVDEALIKRNDELHKADSQLPASKTDDQKIPDHQATTIRQLRAAGRHAEADRMQADNDRHYKGKAKHRKAMLDGTYAREAWDDRYGELLDQHEMGVLRITVDWMSKKCGDEANARAVDHTLWLQSDRLVDAFDIFDPKDQASGFEFTREHLACTHGMFGVGKNEAKLDQWMNIDRVERKNLYMRANLYNDQALVSEASKAFSALRKASVEAGGVGAVSPEKVAKITKSFVDMQKKIDSAWDEWLRDDVVLEIQKKTDGEKGSKFAKNQKALGESYDNKAQADAAVKKYQRRMAKLSQFQNATGSLKMGRIAEFTRVRWSKPTGIDHALVSVAGLMLYPKLGALTEKIAFTEYFKTIRADKMASLNANMDGVQGKGMMSPAEREEYVKRRTPQVEAAAKTEAESRALKDKGKASGSFEKVLAHEQADFSGKMNVLKAEHHELQKKINAAMEELAEQDRPAPIYKVARDTEKKVLEEAVEGLGQGKRPNTNNFRQMRMGAAMFGLEGFALSTKFAMHEGEWTARDRLEAWSSVLSMTSISLDYLYAAAKSIREIDEFGSKVAPHLNKSADIMRGGLKISAGLLSTGAGVIGVVLDGMSLGRELGKQNADRVAAGLLLGKIGIGFVNSGLGLTAAFSYTGPMLKYLVGETFLLTRVAERVALARTLWLIRVARFNVAGFVLLGIELLYTCVIKDDDLQKWCKACVFRKDKKTIGVFAAKPYPSLDKELKELESAFMLVTGREPAAAQPAAATASAP